MNRQEGPRGDLGLSTRLDCWWAGLVLLWAPFLLSPPDVVVACWKSGYGICKSKKFISKELYSLGASFFGGDAHDEYYREMSLWHVEYPPGESAGR